MHDPSTVAFDIKYPWKTRQLRDARIYPNGYRNTFITIWHEDPETDGTDDSCGWYLRPRHGDQKVREKIRREFEGEWDQTNSEYKDLMAWFNEDGTPQMTLHGVVLGMFRRAAFTMTGGNWAKTDAMLKRHLLRILSLADNPVDSLNTTINNRYHSSREDRIDSATFCVYGCLLNWERPWYRHPRWHIWHWRLQIHPIQNLERRWWDRCCICKRRGFRPDDGGACGNWGGDRIWHGKCDSHTLVKP